MKQFVYIIKIMEWCCYLLYSESAKRSYIGVTNNIDRRLKQHNGVIKGGAKYTRIAKDWYIVREKYFNSRSEAQSFEIFAKKEKGIGNRDKIFCTI